MTDHREAPALAERLRALNDLALTRYESLDALYRDHLRRGCALLGLDTGIVSRVEGNRYRVLAVHTTLEGVEPGAVFELQGTYCAAVLAGGGTVAYDRVGALPEMRAHPVYVNMGLESYIAAPIRVFGEIHGTLNFSDRVPRADPFASWDHELVTLMAVSIARAIERGLDRRRLERQRALFEAMFEALPDAVLMANEAREIFMANPAVERVFGYAPDELIGKKTVVLYADPEAYAQAGRARYNAGAEPDPRPFVQSYRRRDGHRFPGETVGVKVADSEGTILGFLGHVRDVSERQQAERLKDELLSTVSHELRTPLTSIRGSLGLVVGGSVPGVTGRARELLEVAIRNAERLEQLVNDLLDAERLSSGRLSVDCHHVEIARLMRGTVEANQGFAKRFDIHLSSSDEIPGGTLCCDEGRVLQVLDNLVSNAIKFSPRGERVTVRAAAEGPRVRFEVEDRGPGLPESLRSRVFERFVQADSSDHREKGGTGLGLYIARRLVDLHGGEIGFETAQGRGTTFWFELPWERACPDAAGEVAPTSDPDT